jgi:predicted DNA-binding antitoxin AbrB/MazE fold protein
MTKAIEAIYERGIIRPVEPLELPEGTRLDVIVISHEQPQSSRYRFVPTRDATILAHLES